MPIDGVSDELRPKPDGGVSAAYLRRGLCCDATLMRRENGLCLRAIHSYILLGEKTIAARLS